MKNNNKQTVKELRLGNKLKRNNVKKILNLRKENIAENKLKLKELIKKETNKNKRKELEIQYKKRFKFGVEENSKNHIIEIKKLNKYFCTRINCEHILNDLNLKIKKGKIIVILGASGSGKSTLLNIMSGLTSPSSGDVIVNNKNMLYLSESQRTKFRKENISFVFQSYNLIPSLTVTENIKVGANLRNKNVSEIKIDDILETLDLTKQAKKYPFQLSGGQNQRISIGRALAKNPNILFADEPTGALDEQKGKEALQMLLDINKNFKTTLVMVTHNPNFADIADVILHVRDGQIDHVINNKTKKKVSEISWS